MRGFPVYRRDLSLSDFGSNWAWLPNLAKWKHNRDSCGEVSSHWGNSQLTHTHHPQLSLKSTSRNSCGVGLISFTAYVSAPSHTLSFVSQGLCYHRAIELALQVIVIYIYVSSILIYFLLPPNPPIKWVRLFETKSEEQTTGCVGISHACAILFSFAPDLSQLVIGSIVLG